MIYRDYGRTGKKVSLLGFGGMRFEDIDNRDRCVQMMVEAARAGVNYFDTAPGYFGGKGEVVFGEGFKELRRQGLPFFCSTKTSRASEKRIRGEVNAQLNRMKVDAIDFYHVWCVLSLESWKDREQKGAMGALRKLKEEGLIRHVCVSSHLPGEELGELLREGQFEGVLFGYSAYNAPFRQEAFAAIAERALGCAVMNPLGGGIIPENPEVFDFVRTRAGQTVVEGALHFLFGHSQISTVLVGFGKPAEIREAVAAVDRFAGAGLADVQGVKARRSEALKELCTGCRYCDHCPEGIPVPGLMDAYNHKVLYGTGEAAAKRLRTHWGLLPAEAAKCTGCGQCEEACTQHLPIAGRLRELAALTPGT